MLYGKYHYWGFIISIIVIIIIIIIIIYNKLVVYVEPFNLGC